MNRFLTILLIILLFSVSHVWAEATWKQAKDKTWTKPGYRVKMPDSLPGILDNSGNLMGADILDGVAAIFLPHQPGQNFRTLHSKMVKDKKFTKSEKDWTPVETFQIGKINVQYATIKKPSNGKTVETALVEYHQPEKNKRLLLTVIRSSTSKETIQSLVTTIGQGIEFK